MRGANLQRVFSQGWTVAEAQSIPSLSLNVLIHIQLPFPRRPRLNPQIHHQLHQSLYPLIVITLILSPTQKLRVRAVGGGGSTRVGA